MYVNKRFGYRSATIQHVHLSFPSIFVKHLQEMLAVLAHTTPSNHEVYEVVSSEPGGGLWYIGFTDNRCEIGRGYACTNPHMITEIKSMLPLGPGMGVNLSDWIEEQRTQPIEMKDA